MVCYGALAAAAVAAASAPLAAAQVWGTQGSWQLVLPAPSSTPPLMALPHAAFVPGTMLVMGNATTGPSQDFDLYRFDIATNTWGAPFDFVPGSPAPIAPFLFTFGGLAVIVDEAAPNVMNMIDQQAGPGTKWTPISLANAPANRIGNRFLVWGSQLLMFAGFDTEKLQHVREAISRCARRPPPSSPHKCFQSLHPRRQTNDLYVLDMSTAVLNPSIGVAWQLVSPPADPVQNVVLNYPPPRTGYSWTPFDIGSLMYGGLSYDQPNNPPLPAGTDVFQLCLFRDPRSPPDPNCHWHRNLWFLLPGYTTTGNTVPPAAWIMATATGAFGGPVPDGRVLHTSGRMGSQLYVFGGITERGPTNELWAFDLFSQNWAPCSSSGGMQPPMNAGWGVGVVMGT